jgi:cytochrome c553
MFPFAACLRAGVLVVMVACAADAARAQASVPDTMDQRMQACTACHGQEGRATRDGYFPRIAGKPAGYLYHQLLNFRDGRRRNAAMTHLIDPLSDDYLQRIAEHFASLDLPYPLPRAEDRARADRARGEVLVSRGDAQKRVPACAGCHGGAMTGVLPATPGLLGLPRDYLVAQLGAWRSGERRAHAPDCMAQIAQRLSVEDIGAVASWLAAQPVPADAKAVPAPATPAPMECGSAAR